MIEELAAADIGIAFTSGANSFTPLKFLKAHSDVKALIMQQSISFDLAEMTHLCSCVLCSESGGMAAIKERDPVQKEKYLSDIMAGKAIFGYALPDVLSLDPLKMSLSASKENEGFILSGPECGAFNGDVSEVICLFAKDEDSVHGFLVGKDAQGLKATRSIGTAIAEAKSTCKVVLENCRVPKDSLMGEGL